MGLKLKSKSLKSPNSKDLKDIILKGLLDENSSTEVQAHQQKLADHSYVLREAFDNYHNGNNVFRGVNIVESSENQLIVTLEGTRTEDLKKIVELLYKNQTKCANELKLLDLYVVADYYNFHKVLPVLTMRIKKLKTSKYFVAIQLNEAVKKNDGKRIKECKKCLYKDYGEIMRNNTINYSLNMLSQASMEVLVNDTTKYRLLDDEMSNLTTKWILHDVESREQIGDFLYSHLNVSKISENTRQNLKNSAEIIGHSPNSIDRYLQYAPPEGTLPEQYDSTRRSQSRASSAGSFSMKGMRSISEKDLCTANSERFPLNSRYNDYSSAESVSPFNTPRSGPTGRVRRDPSSGMRIIMPIENDADNFQDMRASNSRITVMKENGSDRSRQREYAEERPQPVEREIIIRPKPENLLENKNVVLNNMEKIINKKDEEIMPKERVLIVRCTPSPQKTAIVQEQSSNTENSVPQNLNESQGKEKVFIVRRTPSPIKKKNFDGDDKSDVQYDYIVINPDDESNINVPKVKEVDEKEVASFDSQPLQLDATSDTSSFEINENSEKEQSRSPSPKAQERFDLMRLSNPYLRQSLIKKNVNLPNERNSTNSIEETSKQFSFENNSGNVISIQKQHTFDNDRPYSPVPYEGELTLDKTFLLLFSDDVFTVRDKTAVTLSIKDQSVLTKQNSNRLKLYPPSTVSSSTGYAYYKKTNTVYATGGPPPSSKEVYCIVWNAPDLNTYAPDLIDGRHSHGAVCHRDYIFVAGGISESGEALDSVEYLNVHPNNSSGKWESRIKLPHANFGLAMCNSNNGFIVVGGIGPRGTGIRDVIEFNLATSEWNMLPQMNHARAFFQSTMLNDCIYVAGGKRHSDDITMSSVEYYQMGADCWVEITPLTCPLSHGVMVASFDKLFLLQGINDGPIVPIDIYDTKKEEWHRTMKSIGIKRVLYTAIASTD